MFSKFTSILQHAVEAVRPRAAGARQAGDGGGLRALRPRESRAASETEARGGRHGVDGAPGASGLAPGRSSPPAWTGGVAPLPAQEGGRGCRGRTGPPGGCRGSRAPSVGSGSRGAPGGATGSSPDSLTVNLWGKVVIVERDKRNGGAALGWGWSCPVFGGGGRGQDARSCGGGAGREDLALPAFAFAGLAAELR